MNFAEEVESTCSRRCLVENMPPYAHGLEAPEKPILDLERLRRLAVIVQPIRGRVEGGDHPSDPASSLNPNQPAGPAPGGPAPGAPRRAGDAR